MPVPLEQNSSFMGISGLEYDFELVINLEFGRWFLMIIMNELNPAGEFIVKFYN